MRRRLIAACVAALAGCRSEPPSPAVSPTLPAAGAESVSIRPLLSESIVQLTSESHDARRSAMETIRLLAKEGLSRAEVTAMIDMAARDDLPESTVEFFSPDVVLLTSIIKHIAPEHVAQLRNRYSAFKGMARTSALAALANAMSDDSTAAYIALLREHGWPSKTFPILVVPFEHDHRFGAVLLPAFTDGSIKNVPDDTLYGLLLNYAEAGDLPATIAARVRPRLVQKSVELIEELRPMQQTSGLSWRWNKDYADKSGTFEILLDVAGHLGSGDGAEEVLRRAAQLSDPRLAAFASLSLVRLGREPPAAAVLTAAKDPDARGALFRILKKLGRLDVFPASELTQAKLAEADMVRWLAFPTELGRAPDHIELMATRELDVGGDAGAFVYFVFRFKTDPPHRSAASGWMAGVSGPFRKADFPTIESWGDTFSTFTAWDEFNVDEHLTSITDLMESWRAHQARPSRQ